MTQKDESPNASEGPYWSEELLAVLVVGLGDETQARSPLPAAPCLPALALRPISTGVAADKQSKIALLP